MDFDGSWVLSMGASGPSGIDGAGPMLSNGKIGLVPSLSGGFDTSRSVVSGAGGEYGNTVDAFHFCRVMPFARGLTHTLTACRLDMSVGLFAATYTVFASGTPLGTVGYEVRALQQLPHFALVSIAVTPADPGLPHVDLYHELRSAQGGEPKFESSTVNSGQTATYILSGTSAAEGGMCASCCYLGAPGLTNLGFNVLRARGAADVCYNVLRTPVVSGVATLHVLAGCMTDEDAGPTPSTWVNGDGARGKDALRRVILGRVCRSGVVADLIAGHAAGWATLWATDVTVDPKAGITTAETAALGAFLRALRYAMYNLHSSVRHGSAVDLEGGIAMGVGDVWFLPTALFLRPDAAVSALDARFDTLEAAGRSAAAFGFRGAKFPFMEDSVLGGVVWDAEAPLRLFNTALVGVNAWNYYRISQDRDWLRERGYAILRGVADLICSAAVPDPANPAAYHLWAAVGFDDAADPGAVCDNALTVGTAILALQAAVEASYETNVFAKAQWSAVKYGLAVPKIGGPGGSEVIAAALAGMGATMTTLETLLLTTPLLAEAAFGPDSGANLSSALVANVDYWAPRTSDPAQPANQRLVAQANAQAAQVFPSRISAFADGVTSFLGDRQSGAFGNLVGRGDWNDVGLSAMLVLAILQGLGGVQAVGGISDTQFYYTPLALNVGSASTLPVTWERLRISGVGTGALNYVVTNQLLFPTPPLTTSLIAPWSVETLTF